MKRILVVDDSEVVRETLALILGRDFIVLKRSPGKDGLSLTTANEPVDLLILGITPNFRAEASNLLNFAAQAPFAILFLVDSAYTVRGLQEREQFGCLAKPFNPYELKDKVARLLARRDALPKPRLPWPEKRDEELTRYVEFPYLSRTAATLVRRFVLTRLPILVWGEVGCGQERVIRAINALRGGPLHRVFVHQGQIRVQYAQPKGPELAGEGDSRERTGAMLIENADKLQSADQAELLKFLYEEVRPDRCQLLATAQSDLLEKVYQAEFLDGLYYKLAVLTLKLPPLRDRRDDIAMIASWFAQAYAKELGLETVRLSGGANDRLSKYLWFGNLGELETVIARTLTIHRKPHIEAADLVFDDSHFMLDLPELAEAVSVEAPSKEAEVMRSPSIRSNEVSVPSSPNNGGAKPLDLQVLIHELAHELKNPMVSIKTFTQLLHDRYEDEHFRARFQDVVGGDIERMDELLELMIEFGDLSETRATKVSLEDRLRLAVEEVSSKYGKRRAVIGWKGNRTGREICVDEAQLKYILKNLLLAVLSQCRTGSEVQMDVDGEGRIAISYAREGARMASLSPYLNARLAVSPESSLPLRMLLTKQLVERNGGEMVIEHSDGEKEIVRVEFPLA